MNLIQRYIFREFFFPFLLGTGFFTFVFVIPPLKDLVSLTLEKGISFSVTLKLFIYSIPFTGSITIPMGVLFGSLFAMGRLSGDSEITAMRSVGFSYWTVARAVFSFGAIMTVGTFFFINFIMPESNRRYKAIYTNVVYANPSVLIEDRTFETIPNTDKQIAALNVNEDNSLMSEVFLYELDKEKNEITFTYAKSGRWLSNTVNAQLTSLRLVDGETMRINRSNPDEVQHVRFDSVVINVINDIKEFEEIDPNPREEGFLALKNKIQTHLAKAELVSPVLYIEYHKKFALPLSCTIFACIALPLGITLRRSGKGASFGIAILVIFIYYFFMTTSETLGKRGHIDPVISSYVPTAIFAVFALILSVFKLRK